ncbi:cytochrome c biogenesis protein [Candidatus Poribacteria bacterium]
MDSNFGSVLFFTISLIIYGFASFLYILYAALKNEKIGKTATWLLVIGIAANTVALIFRTVEVKHAPFVTTYEAMVFWAWLIALVYLVLQFKFHIRVLGALVTPLAFLAIAFASLLPEGYKQTKPLMPALQSHWLEFHIATCFIGYACFAVSFIVGIAYLIKRTDNLDMIGYKAISVGFPFLTLGIVSGAMWANVAWGSYWQWDPKETWSLITWFVYAIYLHMRVVAKWKGTYSAIVAVVGFPVVMFTFFGVNYLLSGLHSYG